MKKRTMDMRHAIAGCAALMIGTVPALALDGPGRAVVASNMVQLAVLPAQTSAAGNGITKGFIVPYSGTVRLTWEIKSMDGTPVSSTVLVEHLSTCESVFTSSTTFAAQTCDIRVAGGQPVYLTALPSDGDSKVSLRYVRLRYTVVDSDGKSIPWATVPD